ncbi:MAG: hypothetical protein H7Y37_15810 [Anaerolineae bacterium]|nr:hypothetical protein [Gloeobacterales cyanobacterium ES-bin-313]
METRTIMRRGLLALALSFGWGIAAVQAKEIVIPLAARSDKLETYTTKDGHYALVGLLDDQALALVSLDQQKILSKVALGIRPLVVRRVGSDIAVVGGPSSGYLVIVDLTTQKVTRSIDLGTGIFDIAVDGQRNRVIATHPGADRISVLNPKTGQVRIFPMPGPPLAATIDPENGHLLVTLGGKDPLGLAVVNLENGELLARLRCGATPEDLVIDTIHHRAIVLNSGSSDLSVVPLGGGTEQFRTIGLDWRPTRLALSQNGRFAYVTAGESDRLQIVDLQSGVIVRTRPLGRQPTGVSLLSDGSIAVAEAGTQSIRWISPESFSATTLAAPPLGAVSGIVVDITGKPVTAGSLQVEGRRIPLLPDGSFLITKLPPGKYLADVSIPGFPQFSARIQAREGYVTSDELRLPPRTQAEVATGIGFLADVPAYSDLLARNLVGVMSAEDSKRKIILLNGPLGPHPEFAQLTDLVRDLNLLDRDNRLTDDIDKLQTIGRNLGLRHIVVTQVQFTRGYNTAGNPLLNTVLRFFVPVALPNFTPNELRSEGVAVVVDLDKDHSGDKATLFKASGRDDVGGSPLYEEASDGLFRLEVKSIAEGILRQWKEHPPFTILEKAK